MNKRKEIFFFCLLLFVSAAFSQTTSNFEYNYLFVVIDDLRTSLGSYGDELVISPTIDSLSANSITYANAYAQLAMCSPSRSSFLTGLRPDSIRIYDLNTHFRSTVPDVVTLPQMFNEHGYQTIGIGKIFHNGNDDPPSWTKSYTKFAAQYVKEENISLMEQYGKGNAFEIAMVDDDEYKDGKITKRAIKKIKEFKDDPFFIAVGYIKPHLPFNSPQKYWDQYENVPFTLPTFISQPHNSPSYAVYNTGELYLYPGIPLGILPESLGLNLMRAYYSCVTYIDNQVKLLIEELRRNDLLNKTIIVVTSDHGFKLGEYGMWGKHTVMEVDTKVPLIIYHPDKEPATISSIVELVDIYPTLASIAEIEVETQGEKLPLTNLDSRKKNIAISQFWTSQVSAMGYSVRMDNTRYIFWVKDGKIIDEEYYDRSIDSDETINLIEQLSLEKRKELLTEFNKYNQTFQIQISEFLLSIDDTFSIYPNPINGYFNLSISELVPIDELELIVYTLNGKMIISTPIKSHTTRVMVPADKQIMTYQILNKKAVIKSGKIVSFFSKN